MKLHGLIFERRLALSVASGLALLVSFACTGTSDESDQFAATPGPQGTSGSPSNSSGASGVPSPGVTPAANGGTGSSSTPGDGNVAGSNAAAGGNPPVNNATGGNSVGGSTSAGGDTSTGGEVSAGGDTGQGIPGGPGLVAAGVRWVGRVDVTNPNAPRFAWSGTGFVATVSGSSLAIQLTTQGGSDPAFFQPVIDGSPGARFSVAAGTQTVTLATGLDNSEHRVELYRETEGKNGGISVFEGFTEGTLGEPPLAPERFIEIVGDSISAGYGNIGTVPCGFTTETESAYQAYGAIAARALGADASILALSGWGIVRDYGGADPSNVLPNVYDNTLGVQTVPAWQPSVQPQVVVINLGTNDFSLQVDPGQGQFTGAYTAFLMRVRNQYPDAWIFATVGSLLYDDGTLPALTLARAYHQTIVDDAVARGDTRVVLVDYGQQNGALGTGCDSHPNVTEHTRLAGILEAAIRSNLGW